MQEVSLSGRWDFRFDDESDWQSIAVPGCWEELPVAKDRPGPAWYRRRFQVPAAFAGQRIWLRFGAVSYHCVVSVNGRELAQHTGLWDSFVVELTDAVEPGSEAELLVQVEKPASLRGGPDAPAVPGRFPLKTTLAGFLPYVWGQIFGGIWQDVTLCAGGTTVIDGFFVRGDAAGEVTASATLSAACVATLELRDPDGAVVFTATQPVAAGGIFQLETRLETARPWSPHDPALYTARLSTDDGAEQTLGFGLRTLAVEGTLLRLNQQPIYPRLALSWGWYADSLHSNPGPQQVRADLLRLKSLGYNGVKLCLWFPPQYYFDLADELGMLLWVELPMWLPEPSAFFRKQTPIEYERLVRQARQHPSVILYSLGCELNAKVGADLLGPLFTLVKNLAGDALVRDNSGSGEAYGGLLNEYAEYYDYHFYSELPFFRNLLDYFTPRWRPRKPWVFGEFCDLDTFRDLRRLGDPAPWWLSADPAVNPQGARWLMEVPQQEARLRELGLWERGSELEQISEQQGLLHRKWTLETVRSYQEIGGYVITGEVDTPIGTAGMWDDTGRLKFAPEAFRSFNDDLVVLLGWDKRRAWIGGGDRAAYWDSWSYAAGSPIRPHLIASHYGTQQAVAQLEWSVAFEQEPPFAQGSFVTPFAVAPGETRELTVAEFRAPEVRVPRRAILQATLQIGTERTSNSWPLWFFPRTPWRTAPALALLDTTGALSDLPQLAPQLTRVLPKQLSTVLITTQWSAEIAAWVRGGGRVILLQSGSDASGLLPMVEVPFWREALRFVAPHPAWGDFPHDGMPGLQFFGCSTDYALDLDGLPDAQPILQRLDTRTNRLTAYAAEMTLGNGRLLVSTLRFGGGQGEQPLGLARNIAASYLLRCWVAYLASIT